MKRLTKTLKEKIIVLHHLGKTTGQIAEILRIPESMVVRVVSPHY